MADAKAGDLEDEDRIAVLDHLATGVLAPIAADIGGDVADIDVADPLRVVRGLAVLSPAVQHMADPGIGKQRVMRRMCPVHGRDVGQSPGLIDAVVVGRDPDAFRRVDIIGRMAGIGDRDFAGLGRGLGSDAAIGHRNGARRRIGHRQAFAALGVLREGVAGQRSEQHERGEQSQHDLFRLRQYPPKRGYRRIGVPS